MRRFWNKKNEGYNVIEMLDSNVLKSYFGEYYPSAKAYLTNGGEDIFFHDIGKFVLEVAFVNARQYCMPKQ